MRLAESVEEEPMDREGQLHLRNSKEIQYVCVRKEVYFLFSLLFLESNMVLLLTMTFPAPLILEMLEE